MPEGDGAAGGPDGDPGTGNRPDGAAPGGPPDGAAAGPPSDEQVVRVAAEAAEGVVLSRYKQSRLRDFDVTVSFEDGTLDVDVYVNPPEDAPEDAEEVAEAAVAAATDAVDELFE